MFQHTATRRWLRGISVIDSIFRNVSTHSHPKVAANCAFLLNFQRLFQHTATRRWLQIIPCVNGGLIMFQHTATRRWLPSI